MNLPDEMTPAIRDALGVMIFQTGPIAHLLRETGDSIPPKAEEEQAHVLWWFLKMISEHGDNWRAEVGKEMDRRVEKKQQDAADQKYYGQMMDACKTDEERQSMHKYIHGT